jgi:hypothetical protein
MGIYDILTIKSVDYHYWVIYVLLHKYGYYYLPEGKKMLYKYQQVLISIVTVLGGLSRPLIMKKQHYLVQILFPNFSSYATFDLSSGRSHLELAK